jgi:hypothetical protein
MTEKKILVPFGPRGEDLMSVHHALALAERLQARVFLLQWSAHADRRDTDSAWLDEALADVVSSARLAGRRLTHLQLTGSPEEEIIGLVRNQKIDYLVLSDGPSSLERSLLQRDPDLKPRIIRVKARITMTRRTSHPTPNRPDRE